LEFVIIGVGVSGNPKCAEVTERSEGQRKTSGVNGDGDVTNGGEALRAIHNIYRDITLGILGILLELSLEKDLEIYNNNDYIPKYSLGH
jgi:hypothetical protein